MIEQSVRAASAASPGCSAAEHPGILPSTQIDPLPAARVTASEKTTTDVRALIGARLLATNTIWNVVGQVAPLAVGLAVTPFLVRRLGTERFGVLSLAWMAVGYFNLFDFGVGRALTKLIAEKIGNNQQDEVPVLFSTACCLMLSLAAVGGAVGMLLSSYLADHVLNVAYGMRGEVVRAFWVLSLALPFVIGSVAFQGALAAYQSFRGIAFIRIFTGLSLFVAPAAVTIFSRDLVWIAIALLCGRILSAVLSACLCLHVDPRLRAGRWSTEAVRPLLSFGGWMTVSNIVGPLMVNLDRFVIGTVMTMTAVAYYAAAYDVVSRLLVLPIAAVGVLFPAFATALACDRRRAARLFESGVSVIMAIMFPLLAVIVVFAQDGLRLWLGADFAIHSAPVLQWIAIGVLVNSLAQVAFAIVQADGRPDVTAKLHVCELPIYVIFLYMFLRWYGITGAAVAWTVRAILDATVLFIFATRSMSDSRFALATKSLVAAVACGSLGICLTIRPVLFSSKLILLITLLSAFTLVFWRWLLENDQRMWLRSRVRAGVGA